MPRHYTDAELDAYELRPVKDGATGETARYAVHIGGDLLGYVRRSVHPRGWQAYTTTGTSPVWHVGRGRMATTRQEAVVDLLSALGVQVSDRA